MPGLEGLHGSSPERGRRREKERRGRGRGLEGAAGGRHGGKARRGLLCARESSLLFIAWSCCTWGRKQERGRKEKRRKEKKEKRRKEKKGKNMKKILNLKISEK
jgi:hypothetical protein